jgi:hypothetical protein
MADTCVGLAHIDCDLQASPTFIFTSFKAGCAALDEFAKTRQIVTATHFLNLFVAIAEGLNADMKVFAKNTFDFLELFFG